VEYAFREGGLPSTRFRRCSGSVVARAPPMPRAGNGKDIPPKHAVGGWPGPHFFGRGRGPEWRFLLVTIGLRIARLQHCLSIFFAYTKSGNPAVEVRLLHALCGRKSDWVAFFQRRTLVPHATPV